MVFSPINSLKKKRAMRRCMKNLCGLKVRRYAAHLNNLNEYLTIFPGATIVHKMSLTDLNEIL